MLHHGYGVSVSIWRKKNLLLFHFRDLSSFHRCASAIRHWYAVHCKRLSDPIRPRELFGIHSPFRFILCPPLYRSLGYGSLIKLYRCSDLCFGMGYRQDIGPDEMNSSNPINRRVFLLAHIFLFRWNAGILSYIKNQSLLKICNECHYRLCFWCSYTIQMYILHLKILLRLAWAKYSQRKIECFSTRDADFWSITQLLALKMHFMTVFNF